MTNYSGDCNNNIDSDIVVLMMMMMILIMSDIVVLMMMMMMVVAMILTVLVMMNNLRLKFNMHLIFLLLVENRQHEQSNLGFSSRQTFDIKPSQDRISDRAVNLKG